MTIGGLTMNAGGTLDFELGDPARDHIVATNNGNVSLGGTLNVSLFGGFVPSPGQTFGIFEGAIGSLTGVFDRRQFADRQRSHAGADAICRHSDA